MTGVNLRFPCCPRTRSLRGSTFPCPRLLLLYDINIQLGARISGSDPRLAKVQRGRPKPGIITEKIIELWKEWVTRRWNAEAKFLNLERMASDEFLKKNRMTLPTSEARDGKEAQVIFKIASKLRPEVETISLAHNGLTSGRILTTLPHYLPALKNLSLEGNRLNGWKEVDYISGRRGRLEHLRELILTDNPIRELEYKNNRAERYKSEVVRRFPTLEILDGEPVARVGFDAPSTSTATPARPRTVLTTFAWNMEPSFIAGVDGSMVSNFFMRFFPCFDNKSNELLDVYAPTATFSFSSNTSIPARARIEHLHISEEFPKQRDLQWAVWLGAAGGSRNLSRLSGLEKVTQSLQLGNQNIVNAVKVLPRTRHDVGGPQEKFCVDAFPVLQGKQTNLLVTVHGQFTELPVGGVRSFDRSFVLAIAPDNSRAKQAGWDVMILSDQLVVRALSNPNAWRPGPMHVQAGDLLPSPGLQQALAHLPEPQRALMQDIILRTRLNLQFAEDCLKNNDWDTDRAMANFKQVKDKLPPDVFLPADAFLS
ncbi:NTF2-like protein [Daedaleopsis nitida]|nr:NTF2-like protein [Daedaleopsis nitida]